MPNVSPNKPPADSTVTATDAFAVLAVLRRRKWSLILITALVVGSIMAFSFRQTAVYASTAKVLVKPISASQLVAGNVIVNLDTESGLVTSPAVAKIAAETLAGNEAVYQLISHVSVSAPANTQFLEITFTDPSLQRAQQGAQAFAQAYIDFRKRQALDAYSTAAQGYQRQIQELEAELSAKQSALVSAVTGSQTAASLQTEIDSLNSRIAVLQAQISPLLAPSVDPGDIVAPAELPTSPASPNLLRDGLLGLILGLALGAFVAFLRERFDERLAGREDFEEKLGAPVLAIVPRVPGWRKKDRPKLVTTEDPKSGPAEAYRTIRANMQYIARDPAFKVLEVTSPLLGEGKTTTTANLAVTLAQTGKRVVAVSCDLRKPRLHRFFDLKNDVGVTSILAGQADLKESAQRSSFDTLRVIASGPMPPNPAELLDSADIDLLLEELRRWCDYVVIDTPPALAVADALILAARCDGVLVVADASNTTGSSVGFVREQVEQVGGKIVGGILNNLDARRAKNYPSYHYYYSYGYRPEQNAASPNGGIRRRAADTSSHAEDMWR
jgi:capsular exopolysaccharide synthesis family protein